MRSSITITRLNADIGDRLFSKPIAVIVGKDDSQNTYYVHSQVLTTASTRLHQMVFEAFNARKSYTIVLPEEDDADFGVMLDFLYDQSIELCDHDDLLYFPTRWTDLYKMFIRFGVADAKTQLLKKTSWPSGDPVNLKLILASCNHVYKETAADEQFRNFFKHRLELYLQHTQRLVGPNGQSNPTSIFQDVHDLDKVLAMDFADVMLRLIPGINWCWQSRGGRAR